MGIEYKIKSCVPPGYDVSSLLKKLPNQIDSDLATEIYNYMVDGGGFYFVDHLVNSKVASVAFRCFVDEALLHGEAAEIVEP